MISLKQIIPLALWPPLILIKNKLISRKKDRFNISIDQCVHYSGFRYGHHEYNPMETYLLDIHHLRPLEQARRKFIHFLQHYRPHHMDEALGLTSLSQSYPLWIYPWDLITSDTTYHAWSESPHNCSDIMTHFCESGILSYRIDEEFLWGERVLSSISTYGYDPRHHPNTPIRTFELRKCDGRRAYLLLDGNHRVSALSALGEQHVTVEQSATHIAFEKDCEHWYGVKKGAYSKADAQRIFNAYFEGNHHYYTCDSPASIIGPQQWAELYRVKPTPTDKIRTI